MANKLSITYLPSASLLAFVQIVFSTIAVLIIQFTKLSEVDTFDWERSKAYALYVIIFVLAIYTNMKALSVSNVETVIVFRACSPIAVALTDYLFMNRAFPTIRSCISLVIIASGAFVYCLSDSQLSMHGISSYYWVLTYFVLIVIEMTYGKSLTSTVKMNSVWGPVLYCNTFSIVPIGLLCWIDGDFEKIHDGINEPDIFILSSTPNLRIFDWCIVSINRIVVSSTQDIALGTPSFYMWLSDPSLLSSLLPQ